MVTRFPSKSNFNFGTRNLKLPAPEKCSVKRVEGGADLHVRM
jgi:hypothetical protein